MKTNLILTGIILFLFAIYSYSIYELGKRSVKCEPEIHTIDNYIQVKDTVFIPKFFTRTLTENDTIFLQDTFYVWKDVEYVAAIDTTFEDSLLSGWIEFVSPTPLHKASYFNFDLSVRERTIYSTSIKEVYNKSRFFLGIGLRMPLTDEIEPIYFARGGIYLFDGSWLEIPIGLQANYVNKLDWELNAEARVKF